MPYSGDFGLPPPPAVGDHALADSLGGRARPVEVNHQEHGPLG